MTFLIKNTPIKEKIENLKQPKNFFGQNWSKVGNFLTGVVFWEMYFS